jgi:hypothetical protein
MPKTAVSFLGRFMLSFFLCNWLFLVLEEVLILQRYLRRKYRVYVPKHRVYRLEAASRQKASPGHRRLVLLVASKAQNANSDSPKCP